jgi:hypothetical protein
MTAAPELRMVAVSAPSPPTTKTAGYGAEPVVGSWTLAEKLALRPWSDTFTVMLLVETVPVTDAGFGGFCP